MNRSKLPMSDKEQRLHTAGLLLQQVRRNGGTAKELADYLRISQTTISHWQSDDPKRRKRVAPPTDIQLKRLVGYLCYLVLKNLGQLLDIALGYRMRSRERLLLLGAMHQELEKYAASWKDQFHSAQNNLEEIVGKLKELFEMDGAGNLPIEMLRGVYNLSGLPETDEPEHGEVNFNRLCPPRNWNDEFIKNMMLDIEIFMHDQEELFVKQEGPADKEDMQLQSEDHQPEDTHE